MVRNESEDKIFKLHDIYWAYDVWRNRATFTINIRFYFFITYMAIWLIAVSKCFPLINLFVAARHNIKADGHK